MTSQRKLKKRAMAQGMTGPELQLVEMLQEILADMRWMQILAYTNQYLLNQKLAVTDAERDQILEAATRAVDKDSKMHEWSERLARLKTEIHNIRRQVGGAREDIEQGRAPDQAEPGEPGEPAEVSEGEQTGAADA